MRHRPLIYPLGFSCVRFQRFRSHRGDATPGGHRLALARDRLKPEPAHEAHVDSTTVPPPRDLYPLCSHPRTTEGMPFPWRLNRSTISANLELIWEKSVNLSHARSVWAGTVLYFRRAASEDVVKAELVPGMHRYCSQTTRPGIGAVKEGVPRRRRRVRCAARRRTSCMLRRY